MSKNSKLENPRNIVKSTNKALTTSVFSSKNTKDQRSSTTTRAQTSQTPAPNYMKNTKNQKNHSRQQVVTSRLSKNHSNSNKRMIKQSHSASKLNSLIK